MRRKRDTRNFDRLGTRLGWLMAGMVLGVIGAEFLIAPAQPRMSTAVLEKVAAEPAPAPEELSATTASLRAEAAAEAARLEALREARMRLQTELDQLRQEGEAARQALVARQGQTLAARAIPSPPVPEVVQPETRPSVPPPARDPFAETPRPGTPRIYVHHRAASQDAEQRAEEIAQTVRTAGFPVAELRAAPYVPRTRVVRYFHDQDANAAARLAARLGPGWAIQDFRSYLPQPDPGTLEIWLPAN